MVVYPNRKQYNLRQSFVKTLPVKEDEKPDFLYYEHWNGSLTRAFSPNDKYVAWSVIPTNDIVFNDYTFNYWDNPYGTYSDVMVLNLNSKTHIKLDFPNAKISADDTATRSYLETRYIVFSNDETKVAIFNDSCKRIDTFSLTDTTATHLATWYAPTSSYDFDYEDITHVMRFGEYFMIHYDDAYYGLLRFDFNTLTPTDIRPTVIDDMTASSIREFEDGTIIAAGYKTIASVKTAYIRITDSNGNIMSEYYPNILVGQSYTGSVVAITKYGVIFRKLNSSDTMKFFSFLTQQTYTLDNGALNSNVIYGIYNSFSAYYQSPIKFSDDEKSLVYCYGISGTVYYIIWHFNGSTYNITYSGTITAPYGSALSTTVPSFSTPIRIDDNGHIIYYPVYTKSTDITLYQYGEIMFDAMDNYHVDMPFPNYIADDATYTTSDNFSYSGNTWSLNKDFVIKSRRMLNPKKFLDIPGMVYNNDYPLEYNCNLSKLTPQTLSEHLGGPATNRLYTALPEQINVHSLNPYMSTRNMLYSNTGKYGIYTQRFGWTGANVKTMPIQIYNLDVINPDKEPEEEDDDEPKITTTIITTRHQINK